MKKIILFGASGNVGRAIAAELCKRDYQLSVVLRSESKALFFKGLRVNILVANVRNVSTLSGLCDGFDVVISALGKSVSPMDFSKGSFEEVDLRGNTNILNEAKASCVKKFVYVSAFRAEENTHLEYFRVHHAFSESLVMSGLDYAIIKPPAIFSAFVDMVQLARRGVLVNIGSGIHKTNPIYEGDLAKIIVDAIDIPHLIKEAGGQTIYTRKELNDIIQKTIAPNKKVWNMPLWYFKMTLVIVKFLNKNSYHKLAFFMEMIEKDTIAPLSGRMKFEEYIERLK